MVEEGFTTEQRSLIQSPPGGKLFLEGPPGCGKTTAAAARTVQLLSAGVPGQQILVLVPQRTLAQPYLQALSRPENPPGGQVTVVTLGGLAQRMVQWFWPLAAESAGFAHLDQAPVFLTLETAQYYLAQVAQPLLDEGYFEQVAMDRNRLLSQILDNLNKSAVVGFSYTQLSEKLKNAWTGIPAQLTTYDQVQEVASAFRLFCLQNNLLDFSLQFEIFAQHLWPHPLVRAYLQRTYRHLIYDNLEEDVPVAHDMINEWLPDFESALLIYDQGGGNRIFLGADPDYAYGLSAACDQHLVWDRSFVITPDLAHFENVLEQSLQKKIESVDAVALEHAYTHLSARFFTEMVETVSQTIQTLVQEHAVQPGEIAVLTPYLSDSLRYALSNRLQKVDIQTRSIRPSRSLFEEPAARCLISLARIAHPHWSGLPTPGEFRNLLLQVLGDVDLVRADLITKILYRPSGSEFPLRDFDQVQADQQERITFTFGQRYSLLRTWLLTYREQAAEDELDVFFSRLFGEILSQPGFGFHDHLDSAAITAQVIESVQKFRRVTEPTLEGSQPVGAEYLRTVQAGVIAAQYLLPYSQSAQEVNAVLLAPAYTFIMSNQPIRIQFWLDAGSLSWWQRLYQPLTHPYVLSRQWNPDDRWTDIQEFQANQDALYRLTYGLINRCYEHVFLCTNRINERGAEERGPLLQSIQMILRKTSFTEDDHVHPTR